jgi:DNA-binding transcriptional LysR family regulator
MPVDNWDEFRTAFNVARSGTVSGAAEAMGVHHATVIRHIDALEARLGVKLFQRHARGYTPTEAGREVLRVTATTDDQLSQLVSRIQGQEGEIAGELNVTTVPGMQNLIVPPLAGLQRKHPGLRINYASDSRLFRMEYGEAHLAVRAGTKPTEPDNIVQHLMKLPTTLCAHESYAKTHGAPSGPEDFADHFFVNSGIDARPPANRWLEGQVTPEQVVFRSNEYRAQEAAVMEGLGIGFIGLYPDLSGRGLIEIMPADPAWFADLWLVTHVDLHRTPKVQLASAAIKAFIRDVIQS